MYRQTEIKEKYNYIYQKKVKIDPTNIDRQHEPYNSTDVYEYGIFKTHIFKHANDLDLNLSEMKDGMVVLDAGCGMLGPSIYFSNKLPKLKIFAVSNGTQKHKKEINLKIKNNKFTKIIPVFSDYHKIGSIFKKNIFDRILFIESIGFSNDISNLLKQCYSLLKHDGKIYIRTIVIPQTKSKFLEEEYLEIQKNLNGNLYYNQNMIYFLQEAGFKNIKTTSIPLIFSDNIDNPFFLLTIERLGLYKFKKLLASTSLKCATYIAIK